MKQVKMHEVRQELAFIEEAIGVFMTRDNIRTFTASGEIKPGEMFAVRWGAGDDCVLVLKIAEDFEPRIWANCIPKIPKIINDAGARP